MINSRRLLQVCLGDLHGAHLAIDVGLARCGLGNAGLAIGHVVAVDGVNAMSIALSLDVVVVLGSLNFVFLKKSVGKKKSWFSEICLRRSTMVGVQ